MGQCRSIHLLSSFMMTFDFSEYVLPLCKRSSSSDAHWCRPVFPGGVLPSLNSLVKAISEGSKRRLVVECVENIGPHYARTLREWRSRFEGAFGEGGVIEEGQRTASAEKRYSPAIFSALKKEHPDTMSGPHGKGAIEVFRRKWVYYLYVYYAGLATLC